MKNRFQGPKFKYICNDLQAVANFGRDRMLNEDKWQAYTDLLFLTLKRLRWLKTTSKTSSKSRLKLLGSISALPIKKILQNARGFRRGRA